VAYERSAHESSCWNAGDSKVGQPVISNAALLKKARAATQHGRPRETAHSVQCDNTEFPDASAAMVNSATGRLTGTQVSVRHS
jgi:hypothetical protein